VKNDLTTGTWQDDTGCLININLGFTVSRAFWEVNPPGKGGKVSQNAFSDSYPCPERGIRPNTNKGGGVPPLTISPAHSSPHLPNKDGRLCHQFLWKANHVFVDCIYHNHATRIANGSKVANQLRLCLCM